MYDPKQRPVVILVSVQDLDEYAATKRALKGANAEHYSVRDHGRDGREHQKRKQKQQREQQQRRQAISDDDDDGGNGLGCPMGSGSAGGKGNGES